MVLCGVVVVGCGGVWGGVVGWGGVVWWGGVGCGVVWCGRVGWLRWNGVV